MNDYKEKFHTVKEQILKFKNLEENWDSYGARTISQKEIDAAILALLDTSGIPPQVVPTIGGGVQLEWHEFGCDIEIEFDADGRAEIWVAKIINEKRDKPKPYVFKSSEK